MRTSTSTEVTVVVHLEPGEWLTVDTSGRAADVVRAEVVFGARESEVGLEGRRNGNVIPAYRMLSPSVGDLPAEVRAAVDAGYRDAVRALTEVAS